MKAYEFIGLVFLRSDSFSLDNWRRQSLFALSSKDTGDY